MMRWSTFCTGLLEIKIPCRISFSFDLESAESNKEGFSNVYENLASVDDERTLMPKPERSKMSASKETPHTSLNAKKYDVTDDENDEEGVENPYGDVYINEEATLDIPISELPNVIEEKKQKEDEGFKKEYAVRK